jgi:uncharacterized protein with FMN-binding domain/ferredoxin
MKKYKFLNYISWVMFPIFIIILLVMRTNLFMKLNLNFEYIHNLCSFAAITSIFNIINIKSVQVIFSKGPILVGLFTLFLTILFGPFFCGYICPFGTFQKIIRKVGIKFKIKQRKPSKKLHDFLKYIKYIILLFFILLLIFKTIGLYMTIDPYHTFIRIFYGGMTISGSIYLIIVTLLSLSYDRPFCNYLCPYGAFFNLISINRVFKVTRDKNECVNCKICDKSCPVNIKVSSLDTVNDINCLSCNSCISNCPKEKAIGLKTNFTRVIIFITILILVMFGLSLIKKYNYSSIDNTNTIKTEEYSEIEELISDSFGKHNGQGKNRKEIITENTDINENINIEAEKNSIITTNTSIHNDGIYQATVDAYRPNMVVQIELKNDIILNIEILSSNDTKSYIKYASPIIIESILTNNSSNVDTVSGATYTSNGIKNGVSECLKQAKK